jgi:hypothetical protein
VAIVADSERAGAIAQGPQKWNSMSPGQAAVQLFWRLNHARQTVDFVRRQIARFGKLDRAAMSVMEALSTLNTLREYESALLSEGAYSLLTPPHGPGSRG